MQAPNELMNFAPNVVEINMDDQEAVWNSIQEKLHAVLNGKKNGYTFEELYRHVYIMCIHFKSGTLVYNGARRIIKEHIDKMVAKFEQIANYRDLQNQVVFEVNEFWYNFTNHVEFIRDGLLYLERYMSQNGGGEMEMTFDFGWRMFRTEILENQLIKQAMANRLVFNRENGIQANPSDDIPVDYKESPLFNVDTIIEIMTFLTTFKLGLQVSTAARQMAKLSDYVLTKRKPILRPIVIWHGIEGEMELEPFATKLHRKNAPNPEGKKMAKIFDDWYTNMAPKSRICLPETDSPEWLAGVELIYVMDGMNDKTFRFLNSLRDQLQNCQLILNISGFFPKLHQAGLSSQFFHLFNERCFSLVQDNLPCDLTKSFITKWPLWAIFNGIFFPNCRELTLSLDKLMMKVDEVEAPKWLMHSSTESQPRLLKLCADPENWFQFELVTMIQQIKADFFNPTGRHKRPLDAYILIGRIYPHWTHTLDQNRHMFFVEFPNELSNQHHGEWQNGNGEQLRIHPTGITRLPVDQCQWEFKDFYQLPVVQPKVFLSAQRGPIRTITFGAGGMMVEE